MLLADDDLTGLGTSSVFLSANDPTEFFGSSNNGNNSIPSLFYYDNGANSLRFDPAFTSGRSDITASELDDVKRDVCFSWNELGMPINSNDQKSPLVRRDEVLEAMFEGYPRGESVAPSMLKTDQMLSNNVLASNISDFRIDWTWEDGVGRDLEVADGAFPGGLPGVVVNGNAQPWYGLGNPAVSAGGIGQPVFEALVENENIEVFPGAPGGVDRYGAVFGYNRDRGFLRGGDDRPILDANEGIIYADTFATTGNNNYVFQNTYTPWPTAVRITMRLHDPRNVIEGGRTFQFVVPLPKQD